MKRKKNTLYVTLRVDTDNELMMCWEDDTYHGLEYGYYSLLGYHGEYSPRWYRTTKLYKGDIPQEIYTHFEGLPHEVKVMKRMNRSCSKDWGEDGYIRTDSGTDSREGEGSSS